MNSRNLITALAIACLMTIAVAAAGCANTAPSPTPTPIAASQTVSGNNTTFSSGAGFNITFPKNLRVDTNGTENASQPVRVYVYLTPNNTVTAVNVATYPLTSNATLNSFVNYNKAQIVLQGYQNYTQISNQTTTLAGQPAYNLVWQATIPVQLNETTFRNMTVEVNQTFVINSANNTGYVVTYKAIPSDYNTYLAQAQRIVNSFTLT